MSIVHASSTVNASLKPAGDTITLTGTSGSPNTRSDFALSPADASVTWRWETDGSLSYRIGPLGSYVDFAAGVQWADAVTAEYWIRFTNDAQTGDVPPTAGSSALNTWLKVGGTSSSNRFIEWRENTNGFATTRGQVKVEIATDASGSNIVATGYYRGVAEVEI